MFNTYILRKGGLKRSKMKNKANHALCLVPPLCLRSLRVDMLNGATFMHSANEIKSEI